MNHESSSSSFEVLAKLLGASVEEFSSSLVAILLGLSAVGLLTFVILDILKTLLQLRIPFNRWHLLAHIKRSLRSNGYPSEITEEIEEIILRKTTAGNLMLLYEMPTDQMIGQIKSVTNLALSWPSKSDNEKILAAFTYEGLCAESNGDNQIERERSENRARSPVIRRFSENCRRVDLQIDEENDPTPEGKNGPETKSSTLHEEQVEAYVTGIVNSNLSGLQILMARRWQTSMQFASVAVSTALIFSFVDMSFAYSAIFGVAGGVIAPFAHDLVSPLKKVGSLR